jgi:hypothetical protein
MKNHTQMTEEAAVLVSSSQYPFWPFWLSIDGPSYNAQEHPRN